MGFAERLHSNDNALAESKNASVVRKHMGYSRDGRRGMLQVNCKRSANPILASPPVVF